MSPFPIPSGFPLRCRGKYREPCSTSKPRVFCESRTVPPGVLLACGRCFLQQGPASGTVKGPSGVLLWVNETSWVIWVWVKLNHLGTARFESMLVCCHLPKFHCRYLFLTVTHLIRFIDKLGIGEQPSEAYVPRHTDIKVLEASSPEGNQFAQV